ncbi:hypothetical protein [Agromyces sp. SYSU T0242]|uniref:hypothetical protein n=1 Tax=Agromyces litoreus TaxID=3158561 RepID=UPI003391A20B
MTRHLAPALTIGALALSAVLLSGCAPVESSDAAVAPEPTTSPTPTASAGPDAPEPAAEPAGDEASATCDDLLDADEMASLDADGMTLRPELAGLGTAMNDLVADGGLGCVWAKPQGDVAVWAARLAEPDDAWSSRQAALTAAGWTESGDPIPGTLVAPPDYDVNYRPSLVHLDGVTYFASYAAFLESFEGIG